MNIYKCSCVITALIMCIYLSVDIYAIDQRKAENFQATLNFNENKMPQIYFEDGTICPDNVAALQGETEHARLIIDPIRPEQTVYIPFSVEINSNNCWLKMTPNNKTSALVYGQDVIFHDADLANSELYEVKLIRNSGNKLIEEISVGYDSLEKTKEPQLFLKVVTADNAAIDENKFDGTLQIKAKRSADAKQRNGMAPGTICTKGDTIELDIICWVCNYPVSGDFFCGEVAIPILFNTEIKGMNEALSWDESRVILQSDDAQVITSLAETRLSIKSIDKIYEIYGDPQDSDLWFYHFVGNPPIVSETGGVLTLGIPWDDDTYYQPDPKDCHIYLLDEKDNALSEAEGFFYDEGNVGTTGIPGWTKRLSKGDSLGYYIVADKQLVLPEKEAEPLASEQSMTNVNEEPLQTKEHPRSVLFENAIFIVPAIAVMLYAQRRSKRK